MPIANITYQELVDTFKNVIKTNCINITNFASIQACFKSGWTQTLQLNYQNPISYQYIKLISNFIQQATAADVDNDMSSFLNSIGVTNLTKNISEHDYLDFINNLVSFCCTKCNFSVSQYAQNTKYLIYNKNNTFFEKTKVIQNIEGARLIDPESFQTIHHCLLITINQTARVVPCKYSVAIDAVQEPTTVIDIQNGESAAYSLPHGVYQLYITGAGGTLGTYYAANAVWSGFSGGSGSTWEGTFYLSGDTNVQAYAPAANGDAYLNINGVRMITAGGGRATTWLNAQNQGGTLTVASGWSPYVMSTTKSVNGNPGKEGILAVNGVNVTPPDGGASTSSLKWGGGTPLVNGAVQTGGVRIIHLRENK